MDQPRPMHQHYLLTLVRLATKLKIYPTISASKIKFSIYDNPDVGIKFLYPLGWEPVIKKGSDNSTIIEILFPNMTIDNNAGNFSSGHQHGPSTSFIVLSIEEEASNLSDDPNMTGALNLLTKQNLALANQTLTNFQLIKSYGTIFAGNPAPQNGLLFYRTFPCNSLRICI